MIVTRDGDHVQVGLLRDPVADHVHAVLAGEVQQRDVRVKFSHLCEPTGRIGRGPDNLNARRSIQDLGQPVPQQAQPDGGPIFVSPPLCSRQLWPPRVPHSRHRERQTIGFRAAD